MSDSTDSAIEHLSTYLNDHLGGANAGVEMARELQKDVADEPDGQILGTLADDIEQDVEALRGLIERLGKSRNPVKQAAGWFAEKAQRIGVAEVATGSPHLTRLLKVELLSLGVEGKLSLWLALIEVATVHPELAATDLARLADRARDQRSRLETVRLHAARRSFGAAS